MHFAKIHLTVITSCFAICVLFLTGCQQDPFAGLSKPFRERLKELANFEPTASDENLKTDHQKISEHFTQIIADDGLGVLWEASTGEEFQATLTVKIFNIEEEKLSDFVLDVDDPAFEGENYSLTPIEFINYNERRYLLRWTPSIKFLGNDLEKLTQIHLRLQTQGLVVLDRMDTFPIYVKRHFYPPEVQIVDMPTSLGEGDEGFIRVHVLDENATDEHPPVLIFQPWNTSEAHPPKDLNQLLTPIDRRKLEGEEYIWEFTYLITARILGTNQQEHYALSLSAHSAYSGSSQPQKVSLFVSNRVLVPYIVGPAMVTASPGEALSIYIYISGVANSGRLSSQILNLENIPGSLEMFNEMDDAGMVTSLHWDIPKDIDTSKDYKIQLEITNTGIQNGQRAEESIIYTLSIALK